jgi:hypothetical protein
MDGITEVLVCPFTNSYFYKYRKTSYATHSPPHNFKLQEKEVDTPEVAKKFVY